MTNDDKQNLFSDSEVLFAYSRKQAIQDGVLVDVTDIAREAGFRYPVAVTRALWEDIECIPRSKGYQDVDGRLWDVLWMGYLAVRSSKKVSDTLCYQLIMHVGRHTYYTVKLVCGPGDDAAPVVTLMRPDED